jgi:O-succinylbenzoic acid--CoA ligase
MVWSSAQSVPLACALRLVAVLELVALLLPGGPRFVDELRRAWDDGDAVLPVDTRLPDQVVGALLDELAPTVVVDESGARARRAGRPVEAGDALVVATSGTTGRPKGVVLTHDAVSASAHATSSRLRIDPTRHKWLCCLPVAHIGGLSVITRALATGTALEALPRFDVDAVVRAVVERGATHTSLVTTALSRIDAALFERILVGGSAVPAGLPPNVVVTYGMTETGSGIWYDDRPLDSVEVRVDAGDGELFVRGPMLLRCYRDGHDPKTPDGWLPTGDAGELTEDGRLVVHGRRGDVIVTGGEKVWPAAVEQVLAGHPAVAEVMVTGRVDGEWGRVVTAVVVLSHAGNAGVVTVDELREFARPHLPPYALPRAVEIVSSLPRTAIGKLRRPDQAVM